MRAEGAQQGVEVWVGRLWAGEERVSWGKVGLQGGWGSTTEASDLPC